MIFAMLAAVIVAWAPDRTIYTGQDLMEACADQDGTGLLLCKGYIDATISTAMMYRAESYREHQTPESEQRDFICPQGGGLSLKDEIFAIDAYLIRNPQAKSMHAPIAIVNSLTEAYPCR